MTRRPLMVGHRTAVRARAVRLQQYPLFSPLLLIGSLTAILAGGLLQSLAASASVLTLFVITGLTWHRHMAPLIPFCLAYQWLFSFVGFLFYKVFGHFPGGGDPANIESVLYISSIGFLSLALGIRFGLSTFGGLLAKTLSVDLPYVAPKRFLKVIAATFAISFVMDIVPNAIWFGGAQIIGNLLYLRFVPLYMFIIQCVRHRRDYKMMAAAISIATLPELLTGFSDFKTILFMLLVVFAGQWKPWIPRASLSNAKVLFISLVGALLLVIVGVIWSSGIKAQWREEIWHSEVQISPVARMTQFFSIAADGVSNLDPEQGTEEFAARLSSSSLYFSYVLERVPDVIQHSDGSLLNRAIENAIMPRFLFPDKAILGSDSELVRSYAGVMVAGADSGTSVGLAYMAEFYIDFSYPGIFILPFLFGFGSAAALVVLASTARDSSLFTGLAFIVSLNYLGIYEGSFIKILAGLVQQTIVLALATSFLRPRLLAILRISSSSARLSLRHGLVDVQSRL